MLKLIIFTTSCPIHLFYEMVHFVLSEWSLDIIYKSTNEKLLGLTCSSLPFVIYLAYLFLINCTAVFHN